MYSQIVLQLVAWMLVSDNTAAKIENLRTLASKNLNSCGENISEEERTDILKFHNKIRSKVASGKFVNVEGNLMPAAENMMQLKWDCELERSAQKWAEKCVFNHSKTPGLGENLYEASSSVLIDREGMGVSASQAWLDEFEEYGWNSVNLTKPVFKTGIGHATQMIWAPTHLIGCGSASCGGGKAVIVVCHYRRKGNTYNTNIYSPGTPCGNCPKNGHCHLDTFLCVDE